MITPRPLAGMASKERAKARAAHFGSWESTTLDLEDNEKSKREQKHTLRILGVGRVLL